jgi:hypothetical protein
MQAALTPIRTFGWVAALQMLSCDPFVAVVLAVLFMTVAELLAWH